MSTAIEVNPTERRKTGMNALVAALGHDGAIDFLGDLLCAVAKDDGYAGIPGWNYTEWRKAQPERSCEEIWAEIMRLQESDETTGTTISCGD